MQEEITVSDLLENLTNLILNEKNKETKKKLREQHAELSISLQKIAEENIKSDNKEYELALNKLEVANKKIQMAMERSEKIENTIVSISEVLEVIRSIA
ncbi:MAG: hypothetical protein H7A24_05305 [Leptospiraceae bacterium]|nr:hypothetical protein [Leptospiraceae bacterium]MCP5511275.1 hypothetical protein [Leptospiraceae bacterium]